MNPKHTHGVSSPRCPLARRPVQLQPSSPLPSKGADRRLACGRLPKHAPDLTQIEKAFSKLRAQFRKEAARANDAVWRAAGHICSRFMCNAWGNCFEVRAGVATQTPDARWPGRTSMRDRAECRASLELRRYRASHGYWWEFSERPGRCQISPAHAAGRGWGGRFTQVNRSTLPGAPHANRQTQKAGGCAHPGGHPKRRLLRPPP